MTIEQQMNTSFAVTYTVYIKSQITQEIDSLLTSRFHEWRYLTKPKTQKQQPKTYDSADLN